MVSVTHRDEYVQINILNNVNISLYLNVYLTYTYNSYVYTQY